MNNCICGAPIPDGHQQCTVCEAIGGFLVHPVFETINHVVGLDPSFTATGIVILGGDGVVDQSCIKTDASLCVEHRISNVMDCIWGVLHRAQVESSSCLVSIEMNHMTGGRSAQTALMQRELIGHLATSLWKWGPDVERVSPKEAKKALTGNGAASKDEMVDCAKRCKGFKMVNTKYVDQACADALGAALAGMAKHGA